MTRVGVLGAGGRMGQEVCRAVEGAPDMELVATVGTEDDVADLVSAEAAVVVDFTVAPASRENLPVLAAAGVHAVVGTSGLSEADLDGLRAAFTTSNCLVAPNFAVGAVLLMRLAELAAPHFDSVELIELHHDAKVDAPSGTALAILDRLAAGSTDWSPDPTTDEVVPGARGGRGPADIPVHSVRLRGLVAHHEVILGTTGQTLTIRHDSIDRTSFMPGVLAAVRRIPDLPGLTLGLETVLGI